MTDLAEYEWTIVGGGPHAVLIAASLMDRTGLAAGALRIVDPHQRLLHDWERNTTSCGMSYLRSPGAHALEPDFSSLSAWAASHGFSWREETVPPYSRPSLRLFNSYARDVVDERGMETMLVRGLVRRAHRKARWYLKTEAGDTIVTRRVILALGSSGTLRLPAWASRPGVPGDLVKHVYAEEFDRGTLTKARRPVIVGGGVAAVQLAIWSARRRLQQSSERHGGSADPVLLISRRPLQVRQFDSDPCYGGPRCLPGFLSLQTPAERRRVLGDARMPGTVPPDVMQQLETEAERGGVQMIVDEVAGATPEHGGVQLNLIGGQELLSDSVTLATGREVDPGGGGLVDAIREAARERGTELPTDSAGFPIPNDDLQWDEGLYVTGWLAEQQLGPSAANIIGAHNAAKRIVSSLRGATKVIPVAWRHY